MSTEATGRISERRYHVWFHLRWFGVSLQCAVDPNAQPNLSKLEESVVDVDA